MPYGRSCGWVYILNLLTEFCAGADLEIVKAIVRGEEITVVNTHLESSGGAGECWIFVPVSLSDCKTHVCAGVRLVLDFRSSQLV